MPFWVKEVGFSLGLLAAFVVGAKIFIFIVDKVVHEFTKRTATDLDDRILSVVKSPAYYLINLVGLYIAVHRLDLDIHERFFSFVDGAIYVAGVFIAAKIVYEIINVMLEWYSGRRLTRGEDQKVGQEFIPLAEKIVKLFIIASAAIVVLSHFGYNISSLVAALGVTSLAIGMAAKETLSNMISGFILMVDRPFRIGDRVELASGKVGDVIDIGLRSTKVKDIDNNVIVIPNADMVNASVTNQSFPEAFVSEKIRVGVAYGSDVEKVKAIMLDVATAHPLVLNDPPPVVFFQEFGDSSLNFLLVVWIGSFRDRMVVRDAVNTGLYHRFAQEGIEIPFPTRTIHMQPMAGRTITNNAL
ncbi:MAG: mechanosensitive ion channel [Nitrospirota bacterium]|nr:mechanosensitive ion channel [Nitrospirota bacterium]